MSEAWLFRGALHRPPALHGRLRLNDEVVRFEIDHVGGPFDDSGVALLTEQTGDPTAYERVRQGEAITLLDFERRNAKISFPFLGGGITMSVKVTDVPEGRRRTWVFYFVYPTWLIGDAGGLYYLATLRRARRASAPFRRALNQRRGR